ncbi:MAG: patatin-like phospholipase family protein [Chitinophagaceae bacterium]|nr:patatin-like phospholipase family protein [Rubrivivax sp.]
MPARPYRQRPPPRTVLRARWTVAVLMLWLSACSTSHYPINPPLERVDTTTGYRAPLAFAVEPDDRFFLHVSISGGGARAAALGYGALEALRDTPIRWAGRDKRLIDDMDALMGVSGGSMLAAYYALHGTEGLSRFDADFFQTPLQTDLVSLVLSPRNLWRIQSPRFGRGDLMAEYLDERLFKGATFADLTRTPRKPYVTLYASDMSTGARFEFVQEQFDFLCSDLGGVTLARAVAASSAAPLVLSPITLWNHAPADGSEGCGDPPARAIARAANAGSSASQQLAEMETLRATTPEGLLRPYVHLLDGGLSDNVGARGPMDYIWRFGSVIAGTRAAGYRGVRRVAFVVINAETSARPPEDGRADVPGPLRAALALADIPINRNSSTALAAKRSLLEGWRAEVAAAQAGGDFEIFAADARFYLIEVNLGDEPDAALRERLLAVPTTLQLPPADVSLLRRHAAAALRRSPDFQRLLHELRD